jgi:hypothetical protein
VNNGKWIYLIVCASFCIQTAGSAQTHPSIPDDEVVFYAATKQVNQFFRRFNSEESVDGKRYYEKDSLYHDHTTRSFFLNQLFDKGNSFINENLKQQFIQHVNAPTKPVFLDFHGGKWLAQVSTVFYWEGKEVSATLFLNLQEEHTGSKWVINRVCFRPFEEYFLKDTLDTIHFLHPLSHELEFMNLYEVFHDEKELVQNYTDRDYQPDYLTLFLFEVKRGNLRFKTVMDVKFHFFQVDNWYFELSQFIREGYNTGWLISDLKKVNAKEKELLLKDIYGRYE